VVLELLKNFIKLGHLRINENQELFINKENIVLYFVPELIWENYLNQKEFGLSYQINMYLAGKIRSYTFLENGEGVLLKGVPRAVNVCIDAMNSFGFGKFEAKKISESEKFLYITCKSSIARSIKNTFGHQTTPVDFMYAGLFAGALEYYAKERIYCIETNCISQKETPSCEFIAGTEQKIIEYLEKFSPNKIDYAKKLIAEIGKKENKLVPNGMSDISKLTINWGQK